MFTVSPHDGTLRNSLPAWLLSLALHTCLLIALATTARYIPRGAMLGSTREVGIVLVQEGQGDGQREYVGEPTGGSATSANVAEVEREALPKLDELVVEGPGAGLASAELQGSGSVDAAGESTGAGTGPGVGAGNGGGGYQRAGMTRMSVFGITGEGSKFVFVFDRSGSMDAYGGAPLRAAKAELIRGIEQLDSIHQFQIIFYNERPYVFRPDPGEPRLVWGDERGKDAAERFVGGITAMGGTQHLDALKLALGMAPDVIFFLTDADEPRLTDSDLRRIKDWNRYSVIHAIEFGHGRQSDSRSFLVRLAEQNGGRHAYVDVSRL